MGTEEGEVRGPLGALQRATVWARAPGGGRGGETRAPEGRARRGLARDPFSAEASRHTHPSPPAPPRRALLGEGVSPCPRIWAFVLGTRSVQAAPSAVRGRKEGGCVRGQGAPPVPTRTPDAPFPPAGAEGCLGRGPGVCGRPARGTDLARADRAEPPAASPRRGGRPRVGGAGRRGAAGLRSRRAEVASLGRGGQGHTGRCEGEEPQSPPRPPKARPGLKPLTSGRAGEPGRTFPGARPARASEGARTRCDTSWTGLLDGDQATHFCLQLARKNGDWRGV